MRRAAAVWLVAALLAGAARAQDAEPVEPDEQGSDGERAPPAEPAPAEPPPAGGATPEAPSAPTDDTIFGSAHQATFSDDVRLSATRLSGSGQDGSLTMIRLTPAFDFFPVTNFSFGGQVTISYAQQDSGTTSSSIELGLFARVGLNVPISATTSLWPRLALGLDHVGGRLGGSSDATVTTVPLQVFVPFVFQPATHFFFGVGPIVTTDLVAKENGDNTTKMTTIGVQSTLGGYFRGR